MKPDMRTLSTHLKRENEKYPWHLIEVPRERWPQDPRTNRAKLWRSRDFLVQEFAEHDGMIRLSVNRTAVSNSGGWSQDITWDELQSLKHQCGYGDNDAVEIYPRNDDLVNVANMRHLFIYVNCPAPSFILRKQ